MLAIPSELAAGNRPWDSVLKGKDRLVDLKVLRIRPNRTQVV